jgi:LysR family transcriptional regulator, nitrogen assimilation regulatory protein
MDIRQLRYFLGILEAKSVTKAAEVLHVAQPALGLQIRNLERELGVQLLRRHARGVAPTEAGVLLARHAESIVRMFERAQQDLVDYGKAPRGRISLGMSHTAAHVVVGPLLERCRKKFPAVTIILSEGLSKQLVDMVADGRLDIALTYHPSALPGLSSQPLVEDRLVLVRPGGTDRIAPTISLPELFKHELALPSRPHLVREMAEAAARDAGEELRVYCEVDSVATMIGLVRRGQAATLLPAGAVQSEVETKRVRTQRADSPHFRRTLHLVRSVDRPQSKAMDAVYDEIHALAQELARAGTSGWTLPGAPRTAAAQ